jgi:hypothetical protein
MFHFEGTVMAQTLDSSLCNSSDEYVVENGVANLSINKANQI